MLKVETFAFTRYGLIDGTVQAVSRDAVVAGDSRAAKGGEKSGDQSDGGDDAGRPKSAAYLARIKLDRGWVETEVGRTQLGAGMAVTAEIYTGRRRIIGFLLSPLQRLVAESGHER